jgi:hypothetical protein
MALTEWMPNSANGVCDEQKTRAVSQYNRPYKDKEKKLLTSSSYS